jgi:hypothetical protein
LCCRQLPPKRLRLHVVRADPFAVDLDGRDQLAVPRLQLRNPVDPDLLDLEAEFPPKLRELRGGPLAEVASGGPIENDREATDTSPG